MQTTKRTTKTIAVTEPQNGLIDPAILEKAIIGSDLSALNPAQRLEYYKVLCQSLQLNPLTRPFEYITLDGKLTLYARKDCTDQIRKRDGVQIKIVSRVSEEGLYIVTAQGKNAVGREDESIGVEAMVHPDYMKEWNKESQKKEWVKNPLAGKPLSAAERAISMMKAETKAKRRVTLSLGGLGILDESEVGAVEFNNAPATIVQQETAKIEAVANQEKTANAKIVEGGGTVEPITPEPKEKKKKEEVSSTTWRELEIHVGQANGPMLGNKLGEVPYAILEWLAKWAAKLPEQPVKKDRILRDAVKLALEETPKPTETPTEAPETEKGTDAAPKASEAAQEAPASAAKPSGELSLDEEPAKTEERPKIAWKTVKVPVENKVCFGKELGTLEPKVQRAVIRQLVPKVLAIAEDKRTPVQKIFLNACIAMEDEAKPFDDQEFLESLEDADARAEIIRRIERLGMETKDAVEKLVTDKILDPKTKLSKCTLPEAMYVLANWAKIAGILKEEA